MSDFVEDELEESIEDENFIISLTNLTKKFKSGNEMITVLDSLSINFKCESKVIVTGESGSGKSTMLNLIAGLESPTSGSIEVAGAFIEKMRERQLALFRQKNIGLIFQFHYLLKDFTALENIMLPAQMSGQSKKMAKAQALELVDAVGLYDRISHYPSQLSGGERQRIAVARALINQPEIILADEPTGNLDITNSKIVEDLLFRMVDQYKKTLILVTHDLSICQYGDFHYHLTNGVLESQS